MTSLLLTISKPCWPSRRSTNFVPSLHFRKYPSYCRSQSWLEHVSDEHTLHSLEIRCEKTGRPLLSLEMSSTTHSSAFPSYIDNPHLQNDYNNDVICLHLKDEPAALARLRELNIDLQPVALDLPRKPSKTGRNFLSSIGCAVGSMLLLLALAFRFD